MICDIMSERLPGVAQEGSPGWSPAERAHLDSCPRCVAEWRLVQAMSRGQAPIPDIDLDAVARRVQLRLANQRPVASPRGRPVRRWVVGLAAAAALIVAVGSSALVPSPTSAAPQVVSILPELGDLATDELEALFEVIPLANRTVPPPLGAGLSDLSDNELERLFAAMEG